MNRAWREADHPRNPNSGEFVSKEGWATKVSAALQPYFRPRQGRDIRGELDYEKLAERVEATARGTAVGDLALGDIYEAQGFHGRPRLVSAAEMDQLLASGHTELFRGIADADRFGPQAGLTGADFAIQFRKGDTHYPGLGMHGNGSYTTTWQLEARGYSDPGDSKFRDSAFEDSKHWPGVVRMALPPNARVISQSELRSLHARELARSAPHESWQRAYARRQVMADAGRFAAALGYDAIDLGPMSTAGTQIVGAPKTRNHYIILNRSILTVQDYP